MASSTLNVDAPEFVPEGIYQEWTGTTEDQAHMLSQHDLDELEAVDDWVKMQVFDEQVMMMMVSGVLPDEEDLDKGF